MTIQAFDCAAMVEQIEHEIQEKLQTFSREESTPSGQVSKSEPSPA